MATKSRADSYREALAHDAKRQAAIEQAYRCIVAHDDAAGNDQLLDDALHSLEKLIPVKRQRELVREVKDPDSGFWAPSEDGT